MNQRSTRAALWTSLIYGLVAGIWICSSDWLLDKIVRNKEVFARLEAFKGLIFVGLTGGLLFFIVRRLISREEQKIRELKKSEALGHLQRETLELIAGGKPLRETLERLLRGVESLSPGMICSILLLDADGRHLRHGAGPSLPADLAGAIIPTGPQAGSCGTAAFRGAPVFVDDIANSPLWADHRQAVLPHGLRSCWSTPIFDEQKKVLGTFAIYHREPGLPSKSDVRLIELGTHMAATAILKARTEKTLRESEERFRTLVDQASDAIFVHDADGKLLDVNRSACESLGYARAELLQLSVLEIDQDFDLGKAQELWRNLQPGQSQIFRSRHRRKNGETFPVEISLTTYEIQGRQVLAALARNITERAEYEDRLARSVSLLRATIESSDSGVLVAGTDARLTAHNQRFLEMWGIPPEIAAQEDDEKVLELLLTQVVEPEKFLRRVRELYTYLEQDSHDTLILKDGRVIDRISRPQRLGDKIIGRVWHFRDVTSQTRTEQSMRLQSIALEAAANAIIITDRQGRIEWVNPAFTRSTSYTLAESIGKTFQELAQPGKHDTEFFNRMIPAIHDGKVWHGEVTSRRKDGSSLIEDVTITPLLDAENRITHFVAIKQDITGRKRMEAELRQAGERTQFYMNRMPLAFIAWDRDFRVSEWNLAAEKIFGWSAAQAVGRHAFELIVPPDVQPLLNQIWEEVFREGNHAGHSINDNLTKDKRRITCEWHNAPWRDADGGIRGCLSIVDDITERIQSEKKRGELEARLRQSQKMDAIGQLSGGIAHDFNNILTIIQGNASMLQGQNLDSAEAREHLNQISHAAERAAGLTRQLLMFARKQQMQPVRLDLNETVAQITKMLQRILGEDITLRTEYAPALPPIFADTGMIEQIVMNLAVNARDAMPDGGNLTLRTSLDERQVCLRVTDDGGGIAPENLTRIFEPFFTTKEVGKGTGLGLATVYGLVQQHHGKIDVQSEPGKGTTFTISFPAAGEAENAPAGFANDQPALPSGHETILLVEDELPLRNFFGDVLRRCGYTVLEAGSGPAALKLWHIHRAKIALLFTDIIMPENLNGLDLGRRLRADRPDLKVIYTSGYTGNLEDRLNRQLVEGANFIRKPFKPDALAGIIRNNLDGKISPP
jgi:PAS domain S-box-containing protein